MEAPEAPQDPGVEPDEEGGGDFGDESGGGDEGGGDEGGSEGGGESSEGGL